MEVLAPREGERIVDIGCGCGQTSLALAARVGPTGSVVGVDVSKPMLEVALRRQAQAALDAPVVFRELDVQTGYLGHGLLDATFSRFGVMFFGDPVGAFANIRASLKPGGRLAFVCWRPINEKSVGARSARSRASPYATCCTARSDRARAVCIRQREPRALNSCPSGI